LNEPHQNEEELKAFEQDYNSRLYPHKKQVLNQDQMNKNTVHNQKEAQGWDEIPK
jgi:hypothetical protein